MSAEDLPTLKSVFMQFIGELSEINDPHGRAEFTADALITALSAPPADVSRLVQVLSKLSAFSNDPIGSGTMYGLLLGVRVERAIREAAEVVVP